MVKYDALQAQPALTIQLSAVLAMLAPKKLLNVFYQVLLRDLGVPTPVSEAVSCYPTE